MSKPAAYFRPKEDAMTNSKDLAEAIIASIKQGELDTYLKQIAKAAYLRSKELEGPMWAPRPGTATFTDEAGSYPIISVPIPSVPEGGTSDQIPYGGRWYSRASFLRHAFVLREGTYKKPGYDGMTVVIVGAGQKAFKVKFPKNFNGGAKVHDDTGYIYYDRADYLFGS